MRDSRRWLYGALLAIGLFLVGWAPTWAQPTGLIINGQGTATLTWVEPTMGIDAQGNVVALNPGDIAGYVMFFGDQSRFLADGTLRAGCTVRPLALLDVTCYGAASSTNTGTAGQLTLTLNADTSIFFAMTTEHINGEWSMFSSETQKDFVLQVVDTTQPGAPQVQAVDVVVVCTTNQPAITCTFTVN